MAASPEVRGSRGLTRGRRPDLVAQGGGYCKQVGVVGPPFYEGFHEMSLLEARTSLGDDVFESNFAIGAAMLTDDFYEMIVREVDELLASMPAD